VHHRRLQPFAERQEFVVCACASGTAQDRHVAVAVQEGGQTIEFSRSRHGDRLRRQKTTALGGRSVDGLLQGNIARDDHDRDPALDPRSRESIRALISDRSWHLFPPTGAIAR